MSVVTPISRALSCALLTAIVGFQCPSPASAGAWLRFMPPVAVPWVANGRVSTNGNSLAEYSGFSGPITSSPGTFGSAKKSAQGVIVPVLRGLGGKVLDTYHWNYADAGSTSLRALYGLNSASQSSGSGTNSPAYYSANSGNIPVNPAQAVTLNGTGTDAKFGVNSSGEYTPLTDPANLAILTPFDNDMSWPGNSGSRTDEIWTGDVVGSMNVAVSMRDQYLAAGKRIVMLTGHPRGVALKFNELVAISSGLGTLSLASTYNKLWETSCTGCQGTYVAALGAGSPLAVGQQLTLVASGSPLASGQFYIDNTTKKLTTLASDAISQVSTSYSYINSARTGASLIWYNTLVDWLLSTSADFVDNGTDFGRPGFLYQTSGVEVIDTRTPLLDTATGYNKVGTLVDGIHMAPYGNDLVAAATAATDATANITDGAPVQMRAALGQSYLLATAAGSATFSATLPAAMRGAASRGMSVIAGAQTLSDPLGTGVLRDASSNPAGTVDYAGGAISATFPTLPTSGYSVVATQDPTNLVINSGFDQNQGAGSSSVTAVPASSIPKGWTLTGSAVPSDTTLSVGTGTDSLGNPCLDIFLYSPYAVSAPTWTLLQSMPQPSKRLSGSTARAAAHIEYLPGQDGHLRGVSLTGARIGMRSATAVTVPGQVNQATVFSGQDMLNTNGLGILNDMQIPQSGVLPFDSVSPEIPLIFTPDNTSSNDIEFQFGTAANGPVSAHIRISLPAIRALQ